MSRCAHTKTQCDGTNICARRFQVTALHSDSLQSRLHELWQELSSSMTPRPIVQALAPSSFIKPFVSLHSNLNARSEPGVRSSREVTLRPSALSSSHPQNMVTGSTGEDKFQSSSWLPSRHQLICCPAVSAVLTITLFHC